MLTVYSVLCQHKSMLSLAFTLSWTKNLFRQRGKFHPIAQSPACYLAVIYCGLQFSMVQFIGKWWTNSHGGLERDGHVGWVVLVQPSRVFPLCSLFHCCASWKKRRMRLMAGTDCCWRNSTDRVQLHITDMKQRLQHRLSSSFGLSLNFSLQCLSSLQEVVL